MLKKSLALFLVSVTLFAQDVTLKLSGFVKFDAELNTRNVSAARESYFVFYPAPESLDLNNEDKNEVPNLGFYTIHSRLNLKATGPEIFGAKTFGVLEGDFFGTSSAYTGMLRMRIATINFNWENTSLKLGQDWHPLFNCLTIANSPKVNAGTGFQPFGRFPQIQVSQKLTNEFKLTATLLSQRDFASVGLSGSADNLQIKNSLIPETVLQFDFTPDKHLFGAGIEFLSLIPQTTTSNGYKTSKRVNSFTPFGYFKVDLSAVTISGKAVLAQNLTHLLYIGGFGVTKVDAVTAEYEYKPLSTLGGWLDFNYKLDNNISFGVYGGYSKVLTSSEKFINVYGRGITTSSKTGIENLYRVSPRFVYTEKNLKLYTQAELTSAGYGTFTTNTDFKFNNVKQVSNITFLIGTQYSF
ncbi:MAG TPA: hypothetical protein PLI27_05910 [Ignavibacteriales bacterium]|nr:hypothetical protein [Ignavibacteriales bacterium]HOL82156.1 hypothetical protein [Ignavibacteriales bacterium]HOM65736.1 hypothetical protein [Ignavibacteriales bacterium]HPD67591.1 hypothetical protein [Ignavibacteriales bacterium]HPP34284.1 hypothetical protein [Ignavibacteriales bacterium]